MRTARIARSATKRANPFWMRGKSGSAASIEGLRPYAYRCAIRLSLHKYKEKAAAEVYFQYVRVRLIPKQRFLNRGALNCRSDEYLKESAGGSVLAYVTSGRLFQSGASAAVSRARAESQRLNICFTAVCSSRSSLLLASIFSRENSLISSPWTTSQFLPSERTGREVMIPFGVP